MPHAPVHLIAIELTDRDAELVADRCWQAGATGLWEVDAASLRVGVPGEHLADFLTELADLVPRDVTDEEAVELAGRYATVTVAGIDLVLWVPPTVFGDGQHATTATCLAVLPDVVGVGDRVLDVGCGAGALAVAAAALGGRVTAIDIDPVAAAATVDNAARNGVAISVSEAPLAGCDPGYDVVLANLTSGSMQPLVPDLVRRTASGGTLVVSGLLEDQWPAVRDAAGGTVRDVHTVDGWLTAVITR